MHFSGQSDEAMALERKLRHHVVQCSEMDRNGVYEVFTAAHPALQALHFTLLDDVVEVRRGEQILSFPRPLPLIKFQHVSAGYENWLREKYALPGFVEVEPGDVIVDCGAYVGGFALGAARIAGQVHVFEPEARNFDCCRRNLSDFENITLVQRGLYKHAGTTQLNISSSSVEHSLLLPDDGDVIGTQKLQLESLGDYCAAQGIERLDFVKIEAEGVELEVFEGLKGLRPRKLAIDVSPERNGESPAETFREILMGLGYVVKQRGHVMFAHLRA